MVLCFMFISQFAFIDMLDDGVRVCIQKYNTKSNNNGMCQFRLNYFAIEGIFMAIIRNK